MSCHPEILKESRSVCSEAIANVKHEIAEAYNTIKEREERLEVLEKQMLCPHTKWHSPPSMGYNTDTCLGCGWQYSY